MLDKVEYWLDLADDDLPVAKILLNEKKISAYRIFLPLGC